MIACGEKKEEYREIKRYWCDRIDKLLGCEHTYVCFRRGYTSTTMMFKIKDISIGIGNPHWGAPTNEVYKIRLGERIY